MEGRALSLARLLGLEVVFLGSLFFTSAPAPAPSETFGSAATSEEPFEFAPQPKALRALIRRAV